MRLGIVGVGMIAQEVVPNLRNWGIEPAAVCGTQRSIDKAKKLCDENGIESVYTDYDAFLAEADIDTVYIAVPNFLHFSFASKALTAGKNVIVEKPMTSNYSESCELGRIAKEKGLFLFEAITTLYLKNYEKIREWLKRIGEIKIVTANFSQYSSRYDAFKEGKIMPVFDHNKSGGTLMDLNLYNLHYIIGLFGEPEKVSYQANMERGIDTSGIVTMDYGKFQAVSIAAKDCGAPCQYVIQGTKGYILQTTPANNCGEVTLHLNDGTEEKFDAKPDIRLRDEFENFVRIIENADMDTCLKNLEHSLLVSKVQTEARLSAGIVFPADNDVEAES